MKFGTENSDCPRNGWHRSRHSRGARHSQSRQDTGHSTPGTYPKHATNGQVIQKIAQISNYTFLLKNTVLNLVVPVLYTVNRLSNCNVKLNWSTGYYTKIYQESFREIEQKMDAQAGVLTDELFAVAAVNNPPNELSQEKKGDSRSTRSVL